MSNTEWYLCGRQDCATYDKFDPQKQFAGYSCYALMSFDSTHSYKVQRTCLVNHYDLALLGGDCTGCIHRDNRRTAIRVLCISWCANIVSPWPSFFASSFCRDPFLASVFVWHIRPFNPVEISSIWWCRPLGDSFGYLVNILPMLLTQFSCLSGGLLWYIDLL